MTYDVIIRFQFPAWDEKSGITYSNISARSKREAIRSVRRAAYDDGHVGTGGKGRVTFTALEVR